MELDKTRFRNEVCLPIPSMGGGTLAKNNGLHRFFSREAKKSIDGLEEIEKRRIKDRINELMAKRVVA